VRQRRDDAFVLSTSPLGEADLIVTLLTQHSGRVRGVATSARKSRKRFGGALEPMTRVAAAWVERDGRELHRVEALDVQRSFAAMQSDPAVQAAVAVLSEISNAVSREDQAEPKTFRLVGAVLEALEGGLPPWTAVRYAEYWTLKLHGVLPDLQACSGCGTPFAREDPRSAAPNDGLLCRRCPKPAGTVALNPADRAALASFESRPPAAIELAPGVARAGGAIEALLKGTLEAFVERRLKTYRHLRAATAGGSGAP
jgi:DNA repair protein RecO (recombination protein O)